MMKRVLSAILAGKQGEEPTLPGPVISGYKVHSPFSITIQT